jgi:hypothetical protein
MNFDVNIRRRFSFAVATATLLSAGGFASIPQACAEDASSFKSFLGYFGVKSNNDEEAIDYHPRAPLVVPPRLDLRQPKEAARDPSWPKDPDIAAQRRAALDSHTPVAQTTANSRTGTSQTQTQQGSSALPAEGPPDECEASSGTALCLSTPWKALKSVANVFHSETIQPGPEPPRKYLIEPPPGYREPTSVAKATGEATKDKPDAAEPAAPVRSQRPKTSIEN